MRILAVVLIIAVLSGCAAPVWETVDDTIPVIPVSSWLEESYSLQVGIPETVSLLESREDWNIYGTSDGSFELETRRFLVSGLDHAVQTISGFSAEDLNLLQTSRFGLPEYQFVWVSQTEQGSRLYRADLLLDDTTCYAVICSRPEEAGDNYDQEIRQVLATFGLFIDEGV